MKGCKNCPAYAKCIVTYRGSAYAALRGTYGVDDDPEIVTNADHIRAMSDEELADFMVVNICSLKQEQCPKTCKQCWLEWLQQPYKEDIA